METARLSDSPHIGKNLITSFIIPKNFLSKDKRRDIVNSLIGSIDDPTMVEPLEVENDGVIQLMPVKENIDCTIGLRGILADYDEMSVDKFLERKRADAELDL